MSVPAYLRKENTAQFIKTAMRLLGHAHKWCRDDRLFSRRDWRLVTEGIWNGAKGCYTCVKCANRRRNLSDEAIFQEREAYLRRALDYLEEMEVNLTIKYENILNGFNAMNQPTTAKIEAGEAIKDVRHSGGKHPLTFDQIDRIITEFFTLAEQEEKLIDGLMESDRERHKEAASGIATPPKQ